MKELDYLSDNMLPFAAHLGIEFVAADTSRIVAKMEVRPEFCTQPEVLHGGAAMAFADTLGGCAAILNLPDNAWTTTLESKTNFIAPAPVGTTITGETTPVHLGRRTMVWQTRITNSEDRLVALVVQTQLVLEGGS